MKFKKILGITILSVLSIFLVACGQKTPENVEKTELKKEYIGTSNHSGYDNPFDEGTYTLTFNKSEKTVSNSNRDEKVYYEIVPDKKVPKKYLSIYEDKAKGKDHFFINVGYQKDKIWGKVGDQMYCVILTEGGKKIQILEFETGYSSDGYYNFIGKAE
ncbi:hypothetical protein HMPREF9318_00142 [Streptococcus urinalis FB127-CNA-2]|uniref:Lipoprotein n=2 Tax=Streptococcus TaxID=1301 RepID=G5KEX7_9STRE|nr:MULTISPECIES: hypothetical protein [Streptococcus]MEE3699272.1 hypothetical protein [Streptococcus uberis]EHJ56134.1 putative lipoprotein [Streptococcus urinalis 2285-97]EKS21944.1 hypothetical protein HMPREF9318_00142 [Streptococcus urinalis FB127-CNA-2]MBA2796390.1 hypothetical protein [Streptococcus porcinus]VEF31757.1 lipoprotein [Streptococcus urinalis]